MGKATWQKLINIPELVRNVMHMYLHGMGVTG